MQRQKGFSLLEVLVAFAVLALSLGVLMQTFSHSSRNAAISADYSKALALAESKLVSFGHLTSPSEPTAGEAHNGRFRWSLNSAPLELDHAGPSELTPYVVSVEVQWDASGQQRSVNLETIRLTRKR